MDVQDICSGLDPASPHRVSMDGPILKPFGNPIALFMELFFPKPNCFTQSWVGTFSEIQQSNIVFFGPSNMESGRFFADTGRDSSWGPGTLLEGPIGGHH